MADLGESHFLQDMRALEEFRATHSERGRLLLELFKATRPGPLQGPPIHKLKVPTEIYLERVRRDTAYSKVFRLGISLERALELVDREQVHCPLCKGPITEFRDDISDREYMISGMCQKCQDQVFPGQ